MYIKPPAKRIPYLGSKRNAQLFGDGFGHSNDRLPFQYHPDRRYPVLTSIAYGLTYERWYLSDPCSCFHSPSA